MGAKICASEPNMNVIKLRKVKFDELENSNSHFNINDQDNIIHNFTYEEYPFDKSNNNYNSNANANQSIEEDEGNHKKNLEQNDDQSKEEQNQSERNDEMNNVFANQYDSSEVMSKNNSNIINTNTNNHIEENIVDSKIVQESKDNNTQQQDAPENYSKANYNSSYLPELEQEQEQEDQKQNQIKLKEQVQFLPNIHSFISGKVLKSRDKAELVFVSDLKKMINIHIKERIKYSDRFCMITKEHFVLYSTKENYITLKRPLGVLPIDLITKVVLFKLNKNQKAYDHFYICFTKAEATALLLTQINTFFMNTSKETSDNNNNNGQFATGDEALLMFSSNTIELIKKWYVVLTYLINNRKESTLNH